MNEEEMKKYVIEKSIYFNMQEICKLANVNYQTFRGWKNSGRSLSFEKIKAIYTAMNEVHKI